MVQELDGREALFAVGASHMSALEKGKKTLLPAVSLVISTDKA